jgi:quercetin 2,3-dioxygenase
MNTKTRKLESVYAPESNPGFLGKGHIARPVVAVDFLQSDPFIMLMDDMLDKKDNVPVGGPHPHAGFETVTLVLEGELGEGPHAMSAGDLEIMTAGSGIVHTEIISKPMKMRILQLWLNLPKNDRKATPRVQRLSSGHVPKRTASGATIEVYSGTFAGMRSPILNHTPLTIAKVKLDANASISEILPADYTGFLYVLAGDITVGTARQQVKTDEVGWLDRSDSPGESNLEITAGNNGAYFVFYAALPQRHEIVSHGPFIADSMDDIRELYADYRAGKMEHITEVPAEQQLSY